MSNQDVLMILKSIITNSDDRRNRDRNNPKEIMFSYNDRDYSADEVATMIDRMNIDSSFEESDFEYINSLYQYLSSDNRGDNKYSNEGVLLGPLQKKIQEYEILVNKQEFTSNLEELEKIKASNSNLSSVGMINLKSNYTDSHYNLDYLTITKEDGSIEVVSVPDPDYLFRFNHEFADQISKMSSREFINTSKNSTDTALDFVKLDDYLSNQEIQNKMHEPANKDKNLMSAEIQEVTRLTKLLGLNEDIYISIDRYGEVFYKVKDGIFKGHTSDGVRKVDSLHDPSIDNNKAYESEFKNMDKNEEKENKIQSNVSDVNIVFDANRFKSEYEHWEDILNGSDEVRKTEFLNQMSALFDLWYSNNQNVSDELVNDMVMYYNKRKDLALNASNSDGISNKGIFNVQELNLLNKIYNAASRDVELNEEVNNEMDQSDIHGDTKFHEHEVTHPKVLTFRKNTNRNYRQSAFSMIAVILEIICISLLVLMFLSLDI